MSDIIKLNAKNEKLGRFASQVAILLMGKDLTDFQSNKLPNRKIEIENVSALDITAKKLKEKIYTSYSGFPSGLKKQNMAKIIEKKGHAEILRKAVKGMLPKNKLQAKALSNLIIK